MGAGAAVGWCGDTCSLCPELHTGCSDRPLLRWALGGAWALRKRSRWGQGHTWPAQHTGRSQFHGALFIWGSVGPNECLLFRSWVMPEHLCKNLAFELVEGTGTHLPMVPVAAGLPGGGWPPCRPGVLKGCVGPSLCTSAAVDIGGKRCSSGGWMLAALLGGSP